MAGRMGEWMGGLKMQYGEILCLSTVAHAFFSCSFLFTLVNMSVLRPPSFSSLADVQIAVIS